MEASEQAMAVFTQARVGVNSGRGPSEDVLGSLSLSEAFFFPQDSAHADSHSSSHHRGTGAPHTWHSSVLLESPRSFSDLMQHTSSPENKLVQSRGQKDPHCDPVSAGSGHLRDSNVDSNRGVPRLLGTGSPPDEP